MSQGNSIYKATSSREATYQKISINTERDKVDNEYVKYVENMRKGKLGECYVAYILSKYCVVRNIPSGTDVGIDLYCETILNDAPFLHFWVQVKTHKKDTDGKERIYKKHLEYWERQPVPVFVFSIILNESMEPEKIYIFNITKWSIEKKEENKERNLIELESILSFTPNDERNLKKFIKETVPETYVLMKLKEGLISPQPELKEKYVKEYYLKAIKEEYIDKILQTIRINAAFSLIGLCENESDKKECIEKLKKILEQFEDDNHWETFYALGLAEIYFNNSKKAKEHLKKAKKIVEKELEKGDEKGKDTWNSIIERIKRKLSSINDE